MKLNDAQEQLIISDYATDSANYTTAESVAALTGSEVKASTATSGLSASFKGLAASLGISTAALGAALAALAVVAVGIMAFQAYTKAQEEARQKAEASAETFVEESNSIDEYIKRYQELRKELALAKGSEEKTYEAKKKLLDLQTELNEKYGEEYGHINLVSDAYNDQTDAIKGYTKKSAEKFLNENYSAIETADKKMNASSLYNLSYGNQSSIHTESGKKLKAIADSYEASNKGLYALDTSMEKDFSYFSVQIKANPDDAVETIGNFMTDVRNAAKELGYEHIYDEILEISAKELARAQSIVNDQGDIYHQALIAQIASDPTGNLQSGYEEATNAVEKYNEALLMSDDPYHDKNVSAAYNNLQRVKSGITENEQVWGRFHTVIDDVFGAANTGAYEFYNAISNTPDLQNLANQLSGLDDTDLKAMADDEITNDPFDQLVESAHTYGLEMQDVIDLLVQMGIVSRDISENPVVEPTLSYEALASQSEEYTRSVSSIISSITALNSALEEQSETGALSTATILSLIDSGYAAALQFDAETGACQLNTEALLTLTEAKIQNQIEDLNTLKNDISQKLINDGLIADESADSFYRLANAKDAYNSDTGVAAQKWIDADAESKSLEEVKRKLREQFNNSFRPKTKNSVSSSSDPTKDSFTQEYNLLKHNLAMEYITEKDYYDQLNDLNEQYYAGKEEYLDDYRKYEEEIYKGLKSYYKSYVDSQTDMLKKQLEAGRISYQQYTSSVTSLIREMYSEGKISAQEYYGYEQQLLETQKSMYDKALSAVIKRIDQEKGHWQDLIDVLQQQNDALGKQKDKYDSILDVVDDVYQKEIDAQKAKQQAIDDQIASLQKSNEAEKEAIDLANAKYNLEKARTNRTRLVYDSESRQYIYKTDTDAVKSAEQELKDLQLNQKISAMEAEKEAINSTIEELEQYRQLWNNITTTHDTNIKQQLAAQLWGQEYEKIILSSRVEDITAFSENYLAIQSQIDDNTAMIESYETKVAYYDSLKEKWNEVSGSYEEGYSQQMAAMILGQDWEKTILEDRTGALEKFRQDYTTIQQSLADVAWKSANEQIMAAKEAKKAAEGQTGAAGNVSSSQPPVSQGTASGNSGGSDHSSTHTDTPSTDNGKRYNIVDASGNVILSNLTEAKKDNFMKTGPASWSAVEMNPVTESEKPRQYAVLDKETGKMYKDKFTSFETANDWIKQMNGMARMRIVSYHNGLLGDYPSSTPALQSTVKQIGTRRLSPDEFLAILQKKELVINPTQQKTLLDNISTLGNTLLKQQFQPLSSAKPLGAVPVPAEHYTFTISNINLNNVQNVEDFGAEIGKRFKNVMYQNLRSMKYR